MAQAARAKKKRAPRSAAASPATKSFGLSLGGIDNALVVRVGGSGAQSPVYVIPLSIAAPYALKGLSFSDERQLDQFFKDHATPVVQAAIVRTLHIADGAD